MSSAVRCGAAAHPSGHRAAPFGRPGGDLILRSAAARSAGFDRLAEISAPTSLLVGDADYPPLIEADRRAAVCTPGCELTVAPGMDDLPPLREPDLVLRVIKSTLSRTDW
jgi:pimeloyl-ACP methyl ester carboxylesterase